MFNSTRYIALLLAGLTLASCGQNTPVSAASGSALKTQRALPTPCATSEQNAFVPEDGCGDPYPYPDPEPVDNTVLRLHGAAQLVPWDDSGLAAAQKSVSLRAQSLPTSASDTQDYVRQLFTLGRWDRLHPKNSPVGPSSLDPDGCTLTNMDAVYNPDFASVDQSGTADIYPTAIVQGRDVYLGGPNPRPIHVPAALRAPVYLVDRYNNTSTAPVSTSSDYATALHAMMLLANQQEQFQNSDINFDVRTATSLDEASQVFHTDFKALGAGINADLTTSQAAHSNTVYAVFQQVLYDVSSDLKGNYPVNGLFNSNFKVADLNTLGVNGDIDSQNLPTYISNVRYGRGFVVSVTSNDSAQHLTAVVKAAFSKGTASLTLNDQKIFTSSDFKVHAYGGAAAPQLAVLKSGNYKSYFDDNKVTITGLTPIAYTTKLWNDDSVAGLSRTLQYTKRECTPVRRVRIDFSEIIGTARLFITRPSVGHEELYTTITGDTSVDLTGRLDSGDNEFRIESSPNSNWSNQRGVRAAIFVDDLQKDNQEVDCRRTHTNDMYRATINTTTGELTPHGLPNGRCP